MMEIDSSFAFFNWNFWLFFAAVLGIFSILYKNRTARNRFLLLCSILLYYKIGGIFVVFLIFSVLLNYGIGVLIVKSREKRRGSIFFLLSGILLNLSTLLYLRFGNPTDIPFANIVNLPLPSPLNFSFASSILLQIGLCLFTFQAISYIVDLYKRKTEACQNVFDLGLYMSFFPCVMAGIVVKPKDFFLQLKNHYQLSTKEFSTALFFILCGLIKKFVLADKIGIWLDPILEGSSVSLLEQIISIYGFALRIYCEFSAYSDIAIGIASWLGFRLPLNFDSPFRSPNLSSFWKRWHISLSEWIKEYVYIPLGGNKNGKFRMCVGTMASCIVGGIWYSASIPFLIWGALNGIILTLEKSFGINNLKIKSNALHLLCVFLCFNLVCLCFVAFRFTPFENGFAWPETLAWTDILAWSKTLAWADMLAWSDTFACTNTFAWSGIMQPSNTAFAAIAFGLIMHLMPYHYQQSIKHLFTQQSWPIKIIISLVVMLIVYLCCI